MKLVVSVLILAVGLQLAQAAPADKVDCSKIEEILDDAGSAQGLSVLNEKYKLATTPEDFTKRCQEMSDAIKTLRKYNKECYSSLTQQVFSAILRTRSQTNDIFCKPDSVDFTQAVESAKCLTENSLDAVKEAETKTILQSQVLFDSNVADDKLRLRRSCCAVETSKTLFMNATKEKCSKYEKTYRDYIESYTSEAMGLICPESDKLECDKLEPLKLEGVALKSKFFLLPMLKLVKTLDH